MHRPVGSIGLPNRIKSLASLKFCYLLLVANCGLFVQHCEKLGFRVRVSRVRVKSINQSININFFSWLHMSRRKSESEAPVDGKQWRDA